jgi:hypothetical protein
VGLLAGLLVACAFEPYVPPEPPPKAIGENEQLSVDTLALGETLSDDLDCAVGRCQARYRIIVPQPGKLQVSVSGPIRSELSTGPRLARVVLEGVGMQTLDKSVANDDSVSPLVVSSHTERGVHFVLINVLAGLVHYGVTAEFTPSGPPPAPTAVAVEQPQPPPGWQPRLRFDAVDRPGQLAVIAEPGDASDGADFAYDPAADLRALKSYAFAQDPAAELRGEPGSVRGNPFVEKQVQREIRYYLADLGVYQVGGADADFLVSIELGARSTTWYSIGDTLYEQNYSYYFDRWRGAGLYVRAHTYQDGTLKIDFIDPKSGSLIWHGWTTEPISINATDDSILKEAVRKVLSQI